MAKDSTMVLQCLADYRRAGWSDPPCGGCCQGSLCQSIREAIGEGDQKQSPTISPSEGKRLPSLVLIKDNGNGG